MWYSIRSAGSPIGSLNQILKKMPVKIETYSQSRLSPAPVFDCASLLFDEFETSDFISETNFPCLDEIWNTNFIPTPPQSPQIKEELFDDSECFLTTSSSTGIHISDVGCGGSSSSSVGGGGGSCSNSPISGLNQNNDHGGKLLDTYVLHDCMLSGQCMEGLCKTMYSNKPISNVARIIRPETPFHCFSTSPPNGSFSYISSMEGNIEYMEEEAAAQQSHEQQQQQLHQQNQPTSLLPIDNSNHNTNGNFLAMSNDHSYQCQTAQRNFENNHNGKSLIVKTKKNDYCKSRNSSNKNANTKATISQPKISKCRKISSKRSNSNSLLNNDSINGGGVKDSKTNGSKKENNKNILKPTIISVANIKNIPDSFHTKYKVSIKKKRLDNSVLLGCSGTSIVNSSNPVIHVKSVCKKAKADSFSSMSLNNSPACSDSEESSLSFPSSADDPNKTSSPPVKRREHNDSERKRRDHLRNSFNNLRDTIPTLNLTKKRPPRIMILHEATTFVRDLIEQNNELVDLHEQEMEKQKRLLEMLNRMNRSG